MCFVTLRCELRYNTADKARARLGLRAKARSYISAIASVRGRVRKYKCADPNYGA